MPEGITLEDTSPLSEAWRRENILEKSMGILRNQDQIRARRAAETLRTARQGGLDPEQVSRGRQLSSTILGTPEYRMYDQATINDMEAKVKSQRELDMLTESPKLSQWASRYENALIAHDDVETIGAIESIGNAIARRTDAVGDGLRTGFTIDTATSALETLRDSQKSLDEIITEEERRQAETSIRNQRVFDAVSDAQSRGASTDERFASINEAASQDITEDDIRAFLTGETDQDPAGWSDDARGLWRWVTSRNPFNQEFIADRIAELETRRVDALEDRAFEAREREAFWPTPQWRQDIERQIGALDGSDATESLVGLLDILGKNPLRGAQYLFEIGAENGLTIAAAAAATYATRSPRVGASVMGAGSYAASSELYFDELVAEYGYDLNTSQGRSDFLKDPQVILDMRDKSKAYGITVGLLDGASGGLASKALVNNPVGNMVVQMMAQSAMGGGGEFLGRLAAGEDVDWTEVILEAMAEFVTAPVEVAGLSSSGLRRRISRIQSSRESQTLFGILAGRIEGSTLKERDQEKFAEAISAVTADGPIENVYIDPEVVEELFQSGDMKVSLEDFFSSVPELDILEFRQALDTGTPFAIPMGSYAANIAGTDVDTKFQDHIKFDPDALSPAEASTVVDDIRQAQQDLGKSTDKLTSIVGELDGALSDELERLTSEIVSASGITRGAAQRQASILVASARTGAERAGITTAEYLKRYTLPTVQQGSQRPRRAVRVVQPDAVLDAISGGDVNPTVAPWLPRITDELENMLGSGAVETASRADVVDAIRTLQETGDLNGVALPDEEAALPTSVDRPAETFNQGVLAPSTQTVAEIVDEINGLSEEAPEFDGKPAVIADFLDFDETTINDFRRPGWGIMSVAQSGSEYPSVVETARAKILREILDRTGKEYLEMEGVYEGEADGVSFLIVDITEREIEALGRYFKQESILDRRGIVYTDGSRRANVPFTGLLTGDAARAQDFYSVMGNGDAWSLELDFGAVDNTEGNYWGLVTVGGEVELTHWSSEELSSIDPAKAGTGPLRGAERQRSGPDKSFFGANDGVSPTAYKRESTKLGEYKHTVRIAADKLYPWFEDPDGLKEQLDRSKSATQQIGDYEQIIKEAGYSGFFVIAGPLGDVAVLFDEQPVSRVEFTGDAPQILIKNEAFDEWFGDSVVVNSDGSPMMVYHGTPSGEFSAFDVAKQGESHDAGWYGSGFYFTPSLDTAATYAVSGLEENPNPQDPTVLPVYISLKKPFVMDLTEQGWDQTLEELAAMGVTVPEGVTATSIPSFIIPESQVVTFTNDLREQGFDGIVVTTEHGDPEFVVFEPTQVKSAVNPGIWSPDSADMMAQPNRGSIVLPADGGQASINIFETADLSTVLHETGHFFLWQLQRQHDDGLEFAQRDFAEVHKWWRRNVDAIGKEAGVDPGRVKEYLTIGTTEDANLDRTIHTALHEQFARGFEAYVMEGRAPSNALRSVFESFAAWLLTIYRQAKSLNVNIDSDIKAVFDRMLATDDELNAGMERESVDDMIAETAREMGLDEDSYRRLVDLSTEAREEGRQLLRKELLTAERQMRSQAYQARLSEIEAEERDAVNNKPVHRAIQWLGNGRWLGGGAPEGLPMDMRFDTDILVDEYGDAVLKQLPRGRRVLHKKGTGLSADEVAGWFGFDSGAAIIDALIKAPTARDEIKARVRARASEELGDPVGNPSEVEEAVSDALHGEKRGQAIVAEMRAINRLSGGRKRRVTTRALAAHMAREMIQKMPTREALQTHRFLAGERKNAEQAARLLASGDVEGAFEAKRKQLIQHQLYSESRKVSDLVGKAERLASRLKKKSTRENLAGDYLGAIDDILETYSFRKMSGAAEVRRERLIAYVQAMTEAGRANELAIPDHVLQAVKAVPYKTLTVQRLQGVYDSLKNIEHTARRKQKLLDRKQEREVQEVIDELSAAMEASVGYGDVNRIATRKDKVMSGAKGYFNLVRNADTILRRFDGWKDRGIFYRIFKDRIDEAGTNAVNMRQKATEDIDALFAGYSSRERERMAVRRLWPGYDQAMSKWDIISIALNMGNKDNLERLTSRDSRGSFTREQVDRLVDNLDKQDWDFVQSVWDYINTEYWPQIKAREERVTGVAPQKVEPMEVNTKFGTYRGGYYPIVYDSRFSATVGEDRNRDLMESMMAGRFGKAQTANGHTKERAKGGGGRTVELGMHVLFGHINHVIHDLAYGEAVGDAWSLLQDKRVKAMFEEAGRLEDHQALELWVQDVAAGPAAGTHILSGMLRRLKAGFTISKLAFNLSTVAIQITGATQSMAQVGTGNVIAGYSQYVASGFRLADQVSARSSFMAERQKTFQRDVFDLLQDTQMDPIRSKAGAAKWYIMQAGFWAMQKVQYYGVDVPTWLAAHRQGLADGMTDDEAAIHADRMVARAQASGLYADRTAIERGTMGRTARQNEFLRLFTALGSYMFAKLNVANEVAGRTTQAVQDPDKNTVFAIMKGVSDMVLLFTIEAILYNAIKGNLPGDEDNEDETWAGFLASETALSVFSVFPFVRDVSSAVQGYSGGGAYSGISETFGRAISATGDFVSGEATTGDLRAANDLAGLLVPGYPSTAMWRLFEGSGGTGEEPSPVAAILGR